MKNIVSLLKRNLFISSILHFIAPHRCHGCDVLMPLEDDRLICNSCYDNFTAAPPPEVLLDAIIQHYPGDLLYLHEVFSLYSIKTDDILHSLIHSLKYSRCPDIGRELGAEIGRTLQFFGKTGYDALLPVPLHAARRRERGYNQAAEIAYGIASVLDIPVEENWLVRSRYTTTQTLLNAKERAKNISGVFAKGNKASGISNANILLIDDVLTTGSTLNHCAEALLDFGAKSVSAATIASAA